MKTFISILKFAFTLGSKTVPSLMTLLKGPLLLLITTVLQSILNTEAKWGQGNGTNKAMDALGAVQIAAPAIVHSIEIATGKELADEELLGAGIANLQEGLVQILNAFRILPKAAA